MLPAPYPDVLNNLLYTHAPELVGIYDLSRGCACWATLLSRPCWPTRTGRGPDADRAALERVQGRWAD